MNEISNAFPSRSTRPGSNPGLWLSSGWMPIPKIRQGVIVNPVNCRGVMGAGFALAVRTAYPAVYSRYLSLCAQSRPEDLLGSIHLTRVGPELFVCNLFSQLNYGRGGRHADLSCIESGLSELTRRLESYPLPVHSPPLGCGLGGLDWGEVLPVIERVASNHPWLEMTIWGIKNDRDKRNNG